MIRPALIRPIATALLLAALAGPVLAPAAARPLKPEQEAKIQPAGKPVDCIQPSRIRETRVRDDKTIDFYMLGGTGLSQQAAAKLPRARFRGALRLHDQHQPALLGRHHPCPPQHATAAGRVLRARRVPADHRRATLTRSARRGWRARTSLC